jgi:acetylornithine deacetylase
MSSSKTLPVRELLAQMVRIYSVNSNVTGKPGAEREMINFLENEMQSRGFETRRLKTPTSEHGCDNLLVTYHVDDKLPWLMLESHVDTVTLEGMTIDPLAAEIRDGKMWGRGTCDTKGTGATMIEALTRYAAGSDKPNNIAIVFTIDEEFGMTGVRALIKDWPNLGFTPAGVIVGEPTLMAPLVSHNGNVRWIIRTYGVAAHSSNPAAGRSAISDMAFVIQAMESRYIAKLDRHDELTGKAQCSINMIQGGVQYNIIPEHCEIRIDRRIVPGERHADVLPAVEKLLEQLAQERPGLKFSQHPRDISFTCPPLTRQHNAGLTRQVQQALARLSLPTQVKGAPFCTDAGDLDEAGIPTLVIGPGDIAQAHTKDEWIALEQIDKGVDLYLAIMTQPCEGK